MRRKSTRVMTLLTAIGLVGAMSTAAMATPPDESGVVTRGPSVGGYIYDGDGIIVLSGPASFVQGCNREGFSSPDSSFIMPGDGSFHEHFSYGEEPINVYEGEDVQAWLAAICEAVAAGATDDELPQAIAAGVGRLTLHVRVDTHGVPHVHNSLVGQVTTTDGSAAHVNTFAKFSVSGGVLDVHQLRVNYTG